MFDNAGLAAGFYLDSPVAGHLHSAGIGASTSAPLAVPRKHGSDFAAGACCIAGERPPGRRRTAGITAKLAHASIGIE
jgi:hypothetical protein